MLESLANPQTGGVVNFTARPGGLVLREPDLPPDLVWIEIGTTPPATPHEMDDFAEVYPDQNGAWITPDEGRTGAELTAYVPAGWTDPGPGDVVPCRFDAEETNLVILATPGGGTATITVQGSTGTPVYTGVGTLVIDQPSGLSLTQPAAGQAKIAQAPGSGGPDPDASLTQRGYVSVSGLTTAFQQLGDGYKGIQSGLSIGTTATPIATTVLDVRGGYAYFASAIYVGAGNFPASASQGAFLQWTNTSPYTLEMQIGPAGLASNRAFGWRVEPINKKFVLLVNGSGGMFSVYDSSTASYTDHPGGMSGTL